MGVSCRAEGPNCRTFPWQPQILVPCAPRLSQRPHEGALLLFVARSGRSAAQDAPSPKESSSSFSPFFHPVSNIVYFTALYNEVMKWWSKKSSMCHYTSTMARSSYVSLLPSHYSRAHKLFCSVEHMGYTQNHHGRDLFYGQIEVLGSIKEKQNSLFWVTSESGCGAPVAPEQRHYTEGTWCRCNHTSMKSDFLSGYALNPTYYTARR